MPIAAPVLFIASAIYCIILFYWIALGSSLPQSKLVAVKLVAVVLVWVILQIILTSSGVYIKHMNALPPKIVQYGVLPLVAMLIFVFNNKRTKQFIDSLPQQRVIAIHLVRIVVEMGLYYVYVGKKIPQIMTFAGQNFDILAGLTTPFIIYGLYKKKLNGKVVLLWNIISLGLLCYIIILAFLCAPSPLQQLAFDQPNIAIFMNPYSLLPTFIVPMVIFMHLVSIRQLIKKHD